jgi:signal transduction histidine kinase
VDVDITDRVQMYEVLDRKQKNLEAIFDAAPFGMMLVNEQQIVVRANDAVRHMSGKGFHEIINRHPCDSLGCARAGDDAPDDAACEGCWLRKLIETTFETEVPIHAVEVRPLLNDSGEELQPWLSASVELAEVDEARHVLIALNDVTDRKRAEEQLREAMELKSQFVSTVSHELRTPLTSMREAVIIVSDGVAGKLNKDQKHFLDIARRNIDRLGRLIDNVLDFQKLNAGKMTFNIEPHDVHQTIEDVYTTMRPHAEKKQVSLRTDVAKDVASGSYDSDRLIQVLTNLVSNAIKFTPEGGCIDLRVARQDEYLAFRVSDTGLGIPKEDLPKVFNRFFRVHRPGKEIKGTGLGLAIVHKIVTGHGGRIDVESEVNEGTTFSVLLPLNVTCRDHASVARADQQLEAELAAVQDGPTS